MYNFRNLLIKSTLTVSSLGALTACDFVFENNNNSFSSDTKYIQDSQTQNKYWVSLADENLLIIELCEHFTKNTNTKNHLALTNKLVNNHLKINEEIRSVAEFKNISIPTTLKGEFGLNEKALFNSKAYNTYFHSKMNMLLNEQLVTLKSIQNISKEKEIIESTKKIGSMVSQNLSLIDVLLNFEDTYTNL